MLPFQWGLHRLLHPKLPPPPMTVPSAHPVYFLCCISRDISLFCLFIRVFPKFIFPTRKINFWKVGTSSVLFTMNGTLEEYINSCWIRKEPAWNPASDFCTLGRKKKLFSSSSFTLSVRVRWTKFHSDGTNEETLMKGLLTEVWARLREPAPDVEILKTSKSSEGLHPHDWGPRGDSGVPSARE